jgi:hypothetical protein
VTTVIGLIDIEVNLMLTKTDLLHWA